MLVQNHCVKSVYIWSYSGPHFPAFGLNTERYGVQMRKNVDKNNSKYGHFLRSECLRLKCLTLLLPYLSFACIFSD